MILEYDPINFRASGAFKCMTFDIIDSILERADNPGQLGLFFTEHLRDLTGARTVILKHCVHNYGGTGHRTVCVNPERRRKLAELSDLDVLTDLVHDLPSTTIWDSNIDKGPIEEALNSLGCSIAIAIPLRVGSFGVGVLFLLDLPDPYKISSVVEALDMMSTVIALIFRNSLLFENQEAIIEERTFELTQINKTLKHEIQERRRAERERRKLEAKILQTQKLESLSVLSGGIAHDFNNLLMAILGNADITLANLPPTSPAIETINEIMLASRRARELVGQLMAYSGKGKFVVEAFDLTTCVKEMAHLLDVSISKKANLRFNFKNDLPPIKADVTQIRQIIMNLLTNASEALDGLTGYISVSTDVMTCSREYLRGTYLDDDLPAGKYVYLEVADSGCGMDRQTLGKIFDPFFTTKFIGHGLGLAAVLGIVRGHNGAIRIKSGLRKGTTLRVLFPAQKKADVTPSPEEIDIKAWRGKGSVLIVDDEDYVLMVGKRMLQALGFDVLTACDGFEAIEMVAKHQDDIKCVLLDFTMPHIDGYETLVELRKINKSIPVILSSGYSQQDISQNIKEKDLVDFIQKPYAIASLVEKLKKIV